MAFLSSQLFAQKSKITSGVLAVQGGKIADAIEKLELGLSKPELIKKQRDIAKGQYYLHKAYLQVARDTTLTDLRAAHPDAIFKAKENLQMAMANPEAKAMKNQSILDQADFNVWAVLYNEGVSLFNGGNDADALKYFKAADEIYPKHFLTNRMLGSAQLMNKDTVGTVATLKKCFEIFDEKYVTGQTPETMKLLEGDEEYKISKGQLSYLYQQLAVIYEAQGKTQDALDLISEGVERLPEDEDIKRQELIIFQKHPDMLSQAEKKFDAALAKNPKDNNVRLVYASLLERAEKTEKAFELYSAAYDIDPENLQANYGKAAYYINKAAALSTARVEFDSDEELEKADAEIKDLLNEAYPYLLKLHELQPNEAEWLTQLVQITPKIGKTEEMSVYAKKLNEVLNN
ncbi:MAG: tetratricopeptide repeat protein [Bacteroidota bacterium]